MQFWKATTWTRCSYAALCYDEWDAEAEIIQTDKIITKPEVTDEEGNILTEAEYQEVTTVTPAVEAGSRYSFRESELHSLILRAFLQRQDELEERIAALEQ